MRHNDTENKTKPGAPELSQSSTVVCNCRVAGLPRVVYQEVESGVVEERQRVAKLESAFDVLFGAIFQQVSKCTTSGNYEQV